MVRTPSRPRPLVLMILDGYGFSLTEEGNAVLKAKQPHLWRYFQEYPLAAVKAAGIEVGLPWGEMGNSETGHQNMGSGQVIYQPLPRISLAIENQSFFSNPALTAAAAHVKTDPNAALHLMGIASNGGIHGHIDHLIALLQFAAQQGLSDRTYLHAFLDGRDSPPDSATNFIKQLDDATQSVGAGKLATLIGRYFAMDRNNNWDRTRAAYDLLVRGQGLAADHWKDGLKAVYNEADFKSLEVAPAVVLTDHGQPIRLIKDGDAVIFSNYRPDRAVQLTAAFTKPDFKKFPVQRWKNLFFVSMVEYSQSLTATVAFPEEKVASPLGRVVSEAGLKQLRIAESEKSAHVTYFFNGGQEEPFPAEDRVTVPSLNIKDYSEQPAMSAAEISDGTIQAIKQEKYDVIVMNYANADMVAHTGNFEATVKSLEFLDAEIDRVIKAALAAGGAVVLTGDHGHAESVVNLLTHKRSTDHTSNPVPLLYVAADRQLPQPKDADTITQLLTMPIGILADVAPTVLDILGLPIPSAMTAQSLLSSLR
jgi:2,3-bisphosphoglycerate-independent phosphoglycerate mutase